MRRFEEIAITGMGSVTAQGVGVDALWEGVLRGRDRIGSWEGAPAGLAHLKVASCGALQCPADMRAEFWETLGRAAQCAVLAGDEAVGQATSAQGLKERSEALRKRTGMFLATTTAGMDLTEKFYEQYRVDAEKADMRLLKRVFPHELLRLMVRHHGVQGPRMLCLTTCVGSAIAMGAACDALQSGQIDMAVAGGAEAMCRVVLSGFNALKLVAAEGCRPFDKDRPGITVGEGAGMVVLERLADARARGARLLGVIAGFAATCDAHHLTAPEPTGTQAVRAIREALEMAGNPQVRYVNAHGTGTKENDATEAVVLQKAFADMPAVSSTKRLTGHMFGAAGVTEAIITALALEAQVLPGNVGGVEPEFALPLVKEARGAEFGAAVSCNFAFGGNNTALVLRRAER